MTAWRSQPYRAFGLAGDKDAGVIDNAILIADNILAANPNITPVLTLRHLCQIADVSYGLIRKITSRQIEDPYKTFRIRKRDGEMKQRRYRRICVPDPELMKVQKWISTNILKKRMPHPSSVAYSEGSKIYDAASVHCGCSWLIKSDVQNFFESFSEIAVYRVFRKIKFQPLMAFELTRICTRLGSITRLRSTDRWRPAAYRSYQIADYTNFRMGHLPQGAPTSPMLANLASEKFDIAVSTIAKNYGLVYTRYADDITLSTCEKTFGRARSASVVGKIYEAMAGSGLSPNATKTKVVPPGARKVVLGLLVDGHNPRLTRDFKAQIRQHIHFLQRPDVGPSKHARARGFASIVGLRNHLQGLMAFAAQIEPAFAAEYGEQLAQAPWPI